MTCKFVWHIPSNCEGCLSATQTSYLTVFDRILNRSLVSNAMLLFQSLFLGFKPHFQTLYVIFIF